MPSALRLLGRTLLALAVGLVSLGFAAGAPAQAASATGVEQLAVDTGRIEGRVTGTFGEPVSGIYMEFWVHQPGGLDYVTNAVTAVDGSFGVQVQPGRYFIRLNGRSQNRQSTTVDDVEVTALSTARVDVTMPALGVVTGRVTGVTGLPGTFCAYAWRFNGYEWEHGDAACADVTGRYRLEGLEPGRYRIQFYSQGGTHLTQWWDGARHRHGSTPVEVSLDEIVLGVDALLVRTSHLQGRVTTESGDPLQDVRVAAYVVTSGDVDEVAYDATDVAGRYDIDVPAGTYYLRFEDIYEHRYGHEWWNDSRTTDDATAVTIGVDGAVVSGLDAALGTPSVLEGRVTDPEGRPYTHNRVTVYELIDGRWASVERSGTSEDGSFRFPSLGPGTYRLSAMYGDQERFWPDEDSVEDSADVGVPPAATARRDFVIAGRAGGISGTVTDAVGSPVRVNVVAYAYSTRFDSWLEEGSTVSRETNGAYSFVGLDPGTYRVGFAVDSRGPFATEYWDDAPTVTGARDVLVRDRTVTTSVDARLQSSGHITGSITGPAGSQNEVVDVYAWALEGGSWSVVAMDYGATGTTYDLRGLAPGRYKVHFRPWYNLPQEWWSDARTRGAGQWVEVVAGETVSGIDAAIDEPARISGTIRVRRSGKTSLVEAAGVVAYRLVDGVWKVESSGSSDHTGRFEIDSLPAGHYKVMAASSVDGDYPPRWFGDTPDRGNATEITVGAGQPQDGVDITLVPPSIISGTVSRPSGDAIEGVGISVRLLEDGEWVPAGSATTDEDGLYYVDWLRQGTYRVEFDTGGQWVTEWWDGGTSLSTATDVVVGEKVLLDDIDAELARPQVVRAPVQNQVPPGISGTPHVGSQLTAAPGGWTPSNLSYDYQWLQDGAVIAGATAQTVLLTEDHVGSDISVRVTGRKTGHGSAVASSGEVGPVTHPPPPVEPQVTNSLRPSVSGAARVGSVLDASPGTWTPGDMTFTYQWLQDGVPMSGATARTLTVPVGALGARLSVRVTASRAGHVPGTATSDPTQAVEPGRITTESPPVLGGRPRVGRTLTLSTGSYLPAGAHVSYDWFIDGTQSRPRGPRLRLRARHLKKQVWVVVSVSALGYATLTLRTPAVRVRKRQ